MMGPEERALPPDLRRKVREGVLGALVVGHPDVHVGDLMIVRDAMMEGAVRSLVIDVMEDLTRPPPKP